MPFIQSTEHAEVATPSTPASGRRKLYPKTTGWHDLDDAGVELQLATVTGTETLTNKTLTSPVLNSPDINTPDIDGGTIDNTPIGGATPAAGAFTTLSATGAISANDQLLTRPELKDYAETLSTVAATGTTETLDLTNGNVFDVTLDDNCTFTFSNPPATGRAGSFTLILRQDAGGTNTVTWPASVLWAGGAAPTLTATGSAIDILSFVTVDGGTVWFGFLAGLDFS